MIISRQKPLIEILEDLEGMSRIFLIGCAKCATVCKSGGEEEIWQMQEALSASGKEITGSVVIDEVCHMLRVQRDLRAKKQMTDEAEAFLVLACGAGVQSVSAASTKRAISALDTLFLGNIRRFGQFEQKCSLCGDCILNETAGICPVTVCPKGLMNGPCGGMDNGKCEVDQEEECGWFQIYERLKSQNRESSLCRTSPPKDFARMLKPGKIKIGK